MSIYIKTALSAISRGDILDMSKKFIAAAVVAMFCVTAFVGIANDSDAAKQSYILYLEDVTIGVDSVSYDFAYVYFDAKNDDAEDYIAKANAALSAAGLGATTLSLSEDKKSIWITNTETIEIAQLAPLNGVWATTGGTVEEWLGSAKTAIVFDGYVSEEEYELLPATVQDQFFYLGWGYGYDYLFEVKADPAIGAMTNYTVFMTIIKDDLVSWEATAIQFTAEKSVLAWIYGFNEATDALGNSTFAKVKAAYSEKYNSISIKNAGSVASWIETSKGNWETCGSPGEDYISGKNIDFELIHGYISTDQYNGLTDAEKKFWVEDTWKVPGYEYLRVATGEVVEEALSLILIIGIVGALILAVIIAIVLIMVVRKKSGNKAA